MKTALIFGVNGQDGSYLAEFLLEKEYQVVGWIPKDVPVSLDNLDTFKEQITLVKGSLLDQQGLNELIAQTQPDEIYNLASPSSPSASWEDVIYKNDVTALGTGRLLEGIRNHCPGAKFYQSSSSEMFGKALVSPQNEETPFKPRNPYGSAKLHAYWLTNNYREGFGLFATSGIMYNHESPRRGIQYVTRKISNTAVKIKQGITDKLYLGNLDAVRDWGYAPDYVRGMWLMLQQENPDDFVIGTGVTHSVRDFCQAAFSCLGLNYQDYVLVDQSFYRPCEEVPLVADNRKAKKVLNWEPVVGFSDLVEMMVQAEYEYLSKADD